MPSTNTTVQLLALYTDPERHNAQSVTDIQTDRQTDRRRYDANSRSYCVQYDRLKQKHFLRLLLPTGFYRAMHYSAKRGIAIACRLSVRLSVCLSVCNVGGSGSHGLEILETNCTDNWPNTFALRSPKATHLLPGEHGEIWGD